MSNKKDFVDSTFRKKWDREYYEQRARDREAGLIADNDIQPKKKIIAAPAPETLGALEARSEDLNLMKRLGKTNIVAGVTSNSEQGGFYCDKCDVLFKDSVSMMDHYNSKKHLRMEGKSMIVQKSTLEQVRNKLKKGKIELDQKKSLTTEYGQKKKREEEYQSIMSKAGIEPHQVNEDENKDRDEKRDQKKQARDSSSGLNNHSNDKEDGDINEKEVKNKSKEDNSSTNNDKKEVVEEVVEDEDDEEAQLRAMGLPTSFGSSKKKK